MTRAGRRALDGTDCQSVGFTTRRHNMPIGSESACPTKLSGKSTRLPGTEVANAFCIPEQPYSVRWGLNF